MAVEEAEAGSDVAGRVDVEEAGTIGSGVQPAASRGNDSSREMKRGWDLMVTFIEDASRVEYTLVVSSAVCIRKIGKDYTWK
jgi:hypothetical protein